MVEGEELMVEEEELMGEEEELMVEGEELMVEDLPLQHDRPHPGCGPCDPGKAGH